MAAPEQIDLARAAPFRLGTLLVEPALRQVIHAGRSLPETIEPRVMQVLVMLAMANGGIVSRDELVQRCWEGRIVGNDSINRVITRLRKLTESDASCRIETITKVGYRLIGEVVLTASQQPSPLTTIPAALAQMRPNHAGLDDAAWAALVNDVRNLIGTEPPPPAPPAVVPRPAAIADAATPILAVLPFDNLSGDTDLTYFSDGVSEDILHSVARARGLKVIGKASSFRFRGADKTIRMIVAELGATHMLDGSVRRAGNRIRVTAQLVDTGSQLTLWSERYDRAMTDIFTLQDEIAAAIAATLDTWLMPAHSQAAVDPEAYDHYLRARAVYSQDSSHGEQLRCIALLEHTVARAPDFALAWGLLAMFRGLALPRTSDDDGASNRAAAQAEATRALALDPACGPAFMAMALLKPAFSDYAEKRRLAERAYTLTNGDATVAVFYTAALSNTGRQREACAILDGLVAREPLAPMFGAIRAWCYRAVSAGPMAAQMAAETAAAFPDSDYAQVIDGLIALYDGNLARAEAIIGAAPGRLPALEAAFTFQTRALRLTGAERTAFIRHELQATAPVCYLVSVALAAHVGEADLAAEHLCNAIIAGQPIGYDRHDDGRGVARANIAAALFGAPMAALRRHPRFAEACVRLGLHAYWQAHDDWPDCAAEVAPYYDFRAECARVARAIG
jgi:TolB-like protein/DNA-binding winged helix-turn-helix (wHTH) protein